MKNLIKAVLNCMKEIENIDKGMTVGAGTKVAYKGVSDKDVKIIVGKSMKANGLVIFPTNIEEKTETNYFLDKYGNSKQSTDFQGR